MQISVLMSVYNESDSDLSDAINSILKQSYSNIEFVIVNDNPNSERVNNLLSRYSIIDDRIKIYNNPTNLGLQESLIKGINYCTNKYIARMDADDISLVNRFKDQINRIKDDKYDVVASGFTYIDEYNRPIDLVVPDAQGELCEKDLLQSNPIAHSGVIFNKEKILKLGNYRRILYAEDYDLWLRILSAGGKIFIQKEKNLLVRSRRNGISVSNRARQMLSSIYVRKLYFERKKNKNEIDSFSEKGQQEYIESALLEYDEKRIEISFKTLTQVKKYIKQRSYIKAILNIIRVLLNDKVYRQHIFFKIRCRIYSMLER
ncbi:glycosyltransferase [Aerococcus tenax]|uniref:glycosyltransferase n=1 Tax=Aerococcus tenax TaxID=3078812 RepID=UPI0018A784C5|nr:glycosyltransferase [Aerococcus tenax]